MNGLVQFEITHLHNSVLNFVPAEDSEDADENDDIANPTEKLKTAVHSFLQKSANLLQGNYEEFYSDVENKTEDPDSQENVESIDVSVDKVRGRW